MTVMSLVPCPPLLLIDELEHYFDVFIFIRRGLIDTTYVPVHVFSACKAV